MQEKRGGGKFFWGGLFVGLFIALMVVSGVYVVNRIQLSQEMKRQEAMAEKDKEDGRDWMSILGEDDDKKDDKDDKDDVSWDPGSVIDEETLEKIELIEEAIEKNYYLDEVSDEELQEGIYRGMVEALGDPYSEYYTKEELEALYADTSGIYYGIGAYIQADTTGTGYCKISGVMEGAPAQEVDLRAEDIIYKVNGEDVYGLSLQELTSLVKGPEGTQVVLTIVRDGEEMEKTVTRRKVEAPTVEFEMMEDGMAYIQITQFDTITVDQFKEALAMAKGNDMKGLILDLRGNPGGSLMSVVTIARMMLPEGLITYTVDKQGNRSEYSSDGDRQLEVPMVVLVDGNSASASELLAGAIKDHKIGTLVGTTTFGKGIVQKPIQFSDGSAVKLTISAYYTPNGTNIHGIGIEPDIECEFDSDRYYSEEQYDNQLERAKEVLREKMK